MRGSVWVECILLQSWRQIPVDRIHYLPTMMTQDCPAILDLIRFMLVREAQLRPTLRDVSLR